MWRYWGKGRGVKERSSGISLFKVNSMSHGAKAAMGSDELCVNIETHIYILSDTIRKPEADTAI